MMWYGAILALATMWGALKDAGMLDRPVVDGSGAMFPLTSSDTVAQNSHCYYSSIVYS